MKSANANDLDRNSGERSGGAQQVPPLRFATVGMTSLLEGRV
jgi:hypothetical protein